MRKSNESSLKEVIEQLIDSYRLRDKLNEVRVLRTWEGIMGSAVAHRTSGISLSHGVLMIRLTSAPLKEELMYQRERILELMNKELGGNFIKEVRIQ